MENVEKFYSIIEEKQSKYKNVFEFLRTFISIDKKGGRLPPVNTMIRLAPIFDKTFFETCLREKLDSAKIRDKDVEVGQKYLLKVDSTQNTTEEERLRKLKRKLKREMHLEKSWGI